MTTYTVKPGDTLSAIGSQFGVPYSQISGFRSGNPNLIYPGEVLTIPDKVGASAPPVASVPQQASQTQQTVQPQFNQQQSTGDFNEGYLRSKGYNDPNVINNILSNPSGYSIYQDYQRESSPMSSFNTSQPTVPNFQNIYDTAIATGTQNFQTQYDTLSEQIRQRETAKNEAISKISDNPYLSEATMTGRIDKINRKYNADTQTLTNQQTLLQNKITTAKADAQIKVNIATNQYNIENTQYQQNLQRVNQYLSAGLFNNASGADIAQIAVATGMNASMVQSIITASKAKNAPKPTLMSTDDGTNQYIVAVDSTTGSVISKQVIGKSTLKTPGTDTKTNTQIDRNYRTQAAQALQTKVGSDGYVSHEVYLAVRNEWQQLGLSVADFDKNFNNFINPSYWESYNIVDSDTVKKFRGY